MGSLKGLGLLGLIVCGILLVIVGGQLLTAINNPANPQSVTIQQLVNGSVDTSKYVSVQGYAIYDALYTYEEDDRVTQAYFILADDLSGHIIMVRAVSVDMSGRVDNYATLTGMTRKTASELRDLIQGDAGAFAAEGFIATPDLYLEEGAKPGDPALMGFFTVILAGGFLFSFVPFFFPTTVFLPKSMDMSMGTTPPTKRKDTDITATGRFLHLKKIEPEIIPGKKMQKYTNAPANIIPLRGDSVMIYIHHVVRYNFIPISKTHWGIFLSPKMAREIQPGVKLGWKDRPAVEIRYPTKDNKVEILLLTFEHAADQMGFVKLLREKGFGVGTGIRTSAI
jgi:hypothetical protein